MTLRIGDICRRAHDDDDRLWVVVRLSGRDWQIVHDAGPLAEGEFRTESESDLRLVLRPVLREGATFWFHGRIPVVVLSDDGEKVKVRSDGGAILTLQRGLMISTAVEAILNEQGGEHGNATAA